jgi:3-phosphoshikimate 1-carboxyvinyltransferase
LSEFSAALLPSYRARPVKQIGGAVTVPGDKSISHRALMLGAVADGVSEISGLLTGADCLATLGAVRDLGVRIELRDEYARIHGTGWDGLRAPPGEIDLGNSGTAMRLFAGLLAGQPFDSVLTGDESLRGRPMARVAEPLNAMGAQIETRDGCPPLIIHGGRQLHGIDFLMPLASAQVKSAVLLAGLGARGRTVLTEPAVSRDHTERMLAAMGVSLEREGRRIVLGGPQRLRPIRIQVPGDFSSAAFFIVAGCLAARDGLLIRNVGLNPTRLGLLEILKLMGGEVRVLAARTVGQEPVADLEIRRSRLQGVAIPAALVPLAIDEFPIIFIAAAAAAGQTLVRGAAELRHKESDRISVMVAGLQALGAQVEERPDGVLISGGPLTGGTVDSGGNHRVAMAFAVASLITDGELLIRDTRNVATSFPGFAQLARSVGLDLEETRGAA